MIKRRHFIQAGALAYPLLTYPLLTYPLLTHAALPGPGGHAMPTRAIPSSAEPLPVIGIGTYRGFDVAAGSAEYPQLPAVLQALFDQGGRLIDSSPVWTRGREAGIEQMEQSFQRLRTQRIDLMQIHNLVDWKTHLPTLRDWQRAGRIRYLGISHYTASAYAEVEAVLKAERLDFLQINYALDDREVERRILPLCRERGVAVICNRPFGGGGLLGRLKGQPLPAWAAEVQAGSWAQLALKFLLAHPAVTCVIPGTGNPRNMAENAAAGLGPTLSQAQCQALIALAG
jgi:aryl-alcohol dehydrogenase-like predicted oxidoreductase